MCVMRALVVHGGGGCTGGQVGTCYVSTCDYELTQEGRSRAVVVFLRSHLCQSPLDPPPTIHANTRTHTCTVLIPAPKSPQSF